MNIKNISILLVVIIADIIPSASFGIGSITAINPTNSNEENIFHIVFGLSGVAVFASMIAYLFAQFIDIRIFHFWKNLTKGKHLWLRNNASTIFSQFIDTFSVLFLLCTFDVIIWDKFSILLINGFLFKVFFAAVDTPFFYLSTWYLKKKFNLKENEDLSTI